jgi:Leucine-rich repeat (LRR) protein
MFLLYEFDLKDQSTPLYTIVNLSGKPLIKLRIKDISDDYYRVREKILKALIKANVVNKNTGIKWAIYDEEIMVTFIDLRYILDRVNEDVDEEEQYKSVYKIMSVDINKDFIDIYQDIIEYVYTISDLDFTARIPNSAVPGLANLYRLEVLSLSVSDPPVIIPPEFSKLEHLHRLHVAGQELTYIPENLSIIPNLSTLDVSHNKLNPIPLSLFQFYKLETLYIDNNELTDIPDEITQLTRLTHLDISCNNITKYPECINRIHTLRKLVYAENNLTEMPNIKLPNLERLNLNWNMIGEYVSDSVDVPNLRKLKLRQNCIAKFPEFICRLKHLEYLHINRCRPQEIKDTELYAIVSLINDIRVVGNDQSIPRDIGKLTNLEYLDICAYGHNIPDEIMNLRLLKYIRISQTQFNSMSEEMKLALKDKIFEYEYMESIYMESR